MAKSSPYPVPGQAATMRRSPPPERVILGVDPTLEQRERDFGQTPLDWTIYGSVNGWYAESGDYASS
jgi:hypothetical protein